MKKFPTYAKLDSCIDTIKRLAKDCTLLLEQSALITAVLAIQYDWMAPFRVAWLEAKRGRQGMKLVTWTNVDG